MNNNDLILLINELSDDQLNIWLALLLGYEVEVHPYDNSDARLIDPAGAPVPADRNVNGWIPSRWLWGGDCYYPRWVKETDPALKLAHEHCPPNSILRIDYFGEVAMPIYFGPHFSYELAPKPLPRALCELVTITLLRSK